jgi:hypothetical protein
MRAAHRKLVGARIGMRPAQAFLSFERRTVVAGLQKNSTHFSF